MTFNYISKEDRQQAFEVNDGNHVSIIQKVETKRTKSGMEMLEITMNVADSNGAPYIHRITETQNTNDRGQRYFDLSLSSFLDAFGLPQELNLWGWNGRRAAGVFVHKQHEYNGKTYNRAEASHFEPLQRQPSAQQSNVQQPSTQWQSAPQPSAQQNAGFVPNNPAQVYNQDGFPEDIPF